MKYTYVIIIAAICLFSSAMLQGKGNEKLYVYYFHHTLRCQSCLKVEDFADKTLQKNFPDKLADSSIVWILVNLDEEKNYHFEDDYKLETQSLIISLRKDGKETKWKNLDKIWDYLGSFENYNKFVKKEIVKFIK